MKNITILNDDDALHFHPVRGERPKGVIIPASFHTPRDVTTWLAHRIRGGNVSVGEIENVLIEFSKNYKG